MRALLTTFDGAESAHQTEFDLRFLFPLFDRLQNGQWIVADARCSPGESNALLIGKDGSPIRHFCVGDGIQYLQGDNNCQVWVGYFDEGTAGNMGWGAPNGPAPIGLPGLVRFNIEGSIVWQFDGEQTGAEPIYDCYALNVTADAWYCYYSNFPIVRTNVAGISQHWTNDIHGPQAIAVDGAYVLLVGGYGENANRLALLQLDGSNTRQVSETVIDIENGGLRNASLVIGRGSIIHVITDKSWLWFSVADVLAQKT